MKLRLLILLMTAFSIQFLTAQVRIGGNTAPDGFAALQLDGVNQGLRLSRLDNSQRTALNVESNKEAAKGLVIYNTESGNIEFYDGTSWRTLDFALPITNGLQRNATTGKIELGGELIETTTIDQGANKMAFTTNGGTLNINSGVVQFKDNSIDHNVDTYTIKNGADDVYKITNAGSTTAIDMNVSGFTAAAGTNSLNVAGTKTSITGNLRYVDAGATYGSGKVLTSKADGEAYWGTLSPSTIPKTFSLSVSEGTATSGSSGTTGTYLSTSSFNPITHSITLEPGKWIVTGMLYTYTWNNSTNNNNTYLIMMRLYDTTNSKSLYSTGELPEYKGNAYSNSSARYTGNAFSAIPMTCYIEVTSPITVRIDAYTQTNNTYLIRSSSTSAYAWLTTSGSSFKAMRVND